MNELHKGDIAVVIYPASIRYLEECVIESEAYYTDVFLSNGKITRALVHRVSFNGKASLDNGHLIVCAPHSLRKKPMSINTIVKWSSCVWQPNRIKGVK